MLNLFTKVHLLQSEHGANDTNGSKASKLHTHAAGAA